MASHASTHIVDLGDAQSIAVDDPNKIIKKGWLTKEGAFVKSWKLSWFELTRYQVTYYNDDVR